MGIAGILSFILSWTAFIWSLHLCDRIVMCEYHFHREDWERDGRPKGFYWKPKGETHLLGRFETRRLGYRWLLKTPEWMKGDPECLLLLKRFRLFAGYVIACWVIAVLVFIFQLLFGNGSAAAI